MRRRVPFVLLGLALVIATGCSPAGRARAADPWSGQPEPERAAVPTTATGPTTTTTQPARRPVILLYGTFAMTDWSLIEGTLAARGYPVFRFDYGNQGTDGIERSARGLAAFVGDVQAQTGADHVSLVGHSQGGLVARYYIKFLGGQEHVDDLIALSPPSHGTTVPMVNSLALFRATCEACREQLAGSPFLASLNDGDETPPPVDYTVIQTRYDLVVTPYTSAFLDGPSDRVTNITLQDRCPNIFDGHMGITSDPAALHWIEDALDHPGPADPAAVPSC